MSAFANLRISRKLTAAFAAVIAVIFASSAIIYDRLRVIELAKNSRVHTTNILETLQHAMDAMVDQETGLRGYLIAGDAKFLEPYRNGSNAYGAAMQRAKELTREALQKQAFVTGYMMTIFGGLASLIVAILMGMLLTRGIAVPIARMTRAMTALAKGDTTVEVPGINRRDEIGAMATATEIFKDNSQPL